MNMQSVASFATICSMLTIIRSSVALQRESYGQPDQIHSPFGTLPSSSSGRINQAWTLDPEVQSHETKAEEKPKKKKSGLAKMWRIVTGSKKDAQTGHRGMSEQREDDMPLAPPPPLSYLVDRRRPSELNAAIGHHLSTPSLPSTTSPKNPLSPPATSPMSLGTAPSSYIASPASSRPSAGDQDKTNTEKKDSGNNDDLEQGNGDENSTAVELKIVHPVNSELGTMPSPQGLPNDVAPPVLQQMAPSSRPQSAIVREKSLPPLPNECSSPAQPEDNTQTLSTYDLRHIPLDSNVQRQDFFPPHVPLQDSGNRRQSFGGTTSRPAFALQNGTATPRSVDPRIYPGNGYDEFGHSLGSLGPSVERPPLAPLKTSSKRRSKFNFASILGKKSSAVEPLYSSPRHSPRSQEFPSYRSRSLADDEALSNSGYAASVSKHSGVSTGPRMSLTSRKAIDELVTQDSEFVAYRYPSNDQRLDLRW
jgi:hypothetical protein